MRARNHDRLDAKSSDEVRCGVGPAQSVVVRAEDIRDRDAEARHLRYVQRVEMVVARLGNERLEEEPLKLFGLPLHQRTLDDLERRRR